MTGNTEENQLLSSASICKKQGKVEYSHERPSGIMYNMITFLNMSKNFTFENEPSYKKQRNWLNTVNDLAMIASKYPFILLTHNQVVW